MKFNLMGKSYDSDNMARSQKQLCLGYLKTQEDKAMHAIAKARSENDKDLESKILAALQNIQKIKSIL